VSPPKCNKSTLGYKHNQGEGAGIKYKNGE